jgi:hypothetical protein
MFTLGQAAKETGISKTAISRAINSGRLSATRNDLGEYQIDPAELFRVYPVDRQRNTETERDSTPQVDTGLPAVLALVREERDRERQQLQATIDDLRRRLDEATKDRREAQEKLTALLTYQPQASTPETVTVTRNTVTVRPVFWWGLALAASAATAAWWLAPWTSATK